MPQYNIRYASFLPQQIENFISRVYGICNWEFMFILSIFLVYRISEFLWLNDMTSTFNKYNFVKLPDKRSLSIDY